jgi:hypothetical protein
MQNASTLPRHQQTSFQYSASRLNTGGYLFQLTNRLVTPHCRSESMPYGSDDSVVTKKSQASRSLSMARTTPLPASYLPDFSIPTRLNCGYRCDWFQSFNEQMDVTTNRGAATSQLSPY